MNLSFVIPAYNEEARLAYCIASVQREAPGCQIIVVDNGSIDRTAELALKMGAKVFYEATKGITRARQTGLLASETGWVAFIDADNELPEGWLRELVDNIDHGVVAISGPPVFRELRMVKRLIVTLYYTIGVIFFRFLPMTQGGNCVFRRDALISVGGFNTEIDFFGEDTATAIRLSKVGKVVYSPGMFCWSSARRFNAEGFIRTGMRYVVNYFWMWATGRPWTRTYGDHRDEITSVG